MSEIIDRVLFASLSFLGIFVMKIAPKRNQERGASRLLVLGCVLDLGSDEGTVEWAGEGNERRTERVAGPSRYH